MIVALVPWSQNELRHSTNGNVFATARHSVAPTASADSMDGGWSSWPVATTHSPGFWAVTSYALVAEVDRDQERFSSALGGTSMPSMTEDSLAMFRQIFAAQSTLREVASVVRSAPEQCVVGLLLGERLDCPLTLTPYVLIEKPNT